MASQTPGNAQSPASMGEVKQIIRRKIRRREEAEENSLNIYPMMDMMTILLVFLIMQFAASSAAKLQQTDALQIPYSTSTMQIQDALSLQISRNEVTVDGEHVLALRNGTIDPSQKQGGGPGFLVTPLFAKLRQKRQMDKLLAARDPSRQFRGEVQILADKRTPYRTLAEVIYTLGQAEYKNLRFVVNKTTSK